MKSKLLILIPAFNEQETIGEIVLNCKPFGDVLVIDDGCTDDTKLKALAAGSLIHSHSSNLGYEAALSSGFKFFLKQGDWDRIISIDADGEHPINLIARFCKNFDDGSEVVLGSRNQKARLSEFICGLFTKFRYGWNDPLCGMKGYSREIVQKFSDGFGGADFGTKIASRALKHGYSFSEIPIECNRRIGIPRILGGLRGNLRILSILPNLIL